jgi:hypothetical protein
MLGYVLTGVAGGLAAAAGSLVMGYTVMVVILLYSLFGILAMIGFGVLVMRGPSRA